MSPPANELDLFLRAVADPARRRILSAIKTREEPAQRKRKGMSASEIEKLLKLAQPTISHHMKVLQKAGIVEATREGHWQLYHRNEATIAAMLRRLKDQL